MEVSEKVRLPHCKNSQAVGRITFFVAIVREALKKREGTDKYRNINELGKRPREQHSRLCRLKSLTNVDLDFGYYRIGHMFLLN